MTDTDNSELKQTTIQKNAARVKGHEFKLLLGKINDLYVHKSHQDLQPLSDPQKPRLSLTGPVLI